MAIFELRRNASVLIGSVRHELKKQLDDGTWQLEDSSTGKLVEHHADALLEMLRTGELTYAPAPARPSGSDRLDTDMQQRTGTSLWDSASDADKDSARRALSYVKATLSAPAHRPLIDKITTRVAHDTKDPQRPSIASVLRWRAAYIVGGMDIAALLPRSKSKGNRKPRFSSTMRTLLCDALDSSYLTPERPTLNDALERAVELVERDNRSRPQGDPELPLPTRRMLRSVLETYDPYEVRVARFGREYAEHKLHQSLGHCSVEHGLDRVEFDHTPINLMVIDDRTFLPLGRPTLTLALDVRHRTVQGFSLGFEPPSYMSVMRCMRHAIMPKSYLKKTYPKLKHAWPIHGVMCSAGLDNGPEFHAKALEDFAGRYCITLDYCPVRKPWWKGTIERFLGTINRGIAHGVPGTTFANILERADYDSSKTACITLSALIEMIHIWIVDYYHQRVHRSLGMSPEASWNAEMTKRPIPLPTSAIELDQVLSIPDRRTLTHKGIELDHLFYNSTALKSMLVRGGGSVPVEIRKSPEDLGHIYVFDARAGSYIRVPVIERFANYAKGLSAWQHKVCVQYARRHYEGRNDVVALADAKQRIREVVAKALKAKTLASRKWASRFDQSDATNFEAPSSSGPMDHQATAPQPQTVAKPVRPSRGGAATKDKSAKKAIGKGKRNASSPPQIRKLNVAYVQRRHA